MFENLDQIIYSATGTTSSVQVANQPVPIKTPEGQRFFQRMYLEYQDAKEAGGPVFLAIKERIQRAFFTTDREMSDFIFDEKSLAEKPMTETDLEGWAQYRFLSDRWSVCNYFVNKYEKESNH